MNIMNKKRSTWTRRIRLWIACLGISFCSYAQSYEIDEWTLKELNWMMHESARISDLYDLKSEELALAHQEIVLLDSLRQLDQKDRKPCIWKKYNFGTHSLTGYKPKPGRNSGGQGGRRCFCGRSGRGGPAMVVVLVVIGMGK